MLSYAEALAALAALEVVERTELRPLREAAGCILAAPVRIDRDQPGFDRATMDGYAVRLDGDRARFPVVATVTAGEAFDGALAPGQALRIMTGAPCPPDVTVVPIELTDGGLDEVQVRERGALAPGRNIAWRGEDARAGDVVLEAGTRLAAATLSAAAMAGARELEVYRAPRVGVVTTGDEVGQDGPAGIRDSNGPLLAGFLGALGCPFARAHAPDDAAALERALATAAGDAEVVVTVGGVSMGAKDFIPGAAARLGYETVFHKVAVQPGKPIFAARSAAGRLLVGLPGNPVSVLATAHLFLLPALGRFLGGWLPAWLELPLASAFAQRGDRHLFLPATLGDGGVRPVAWNGSGDLLAAAAGDGLVDLPPGNSFAAGAPVRFLPYVGHTLGERGTLPPRASRGRGR
jgi:molybdopterin molybdotransferase